VETVVGKDYAFTQPSITLPVVGVWAALAADVLRKGD
jgi:ABC-type hemin transport system substrate-binding protein